MKFSKWFKKVKSYKYNKSKNRFIRKTIDINANGRITIESVAQCISKIVDMKLEELK